MGQNLDMFWGSPKSLYLVEAPDRLRKLPFSEIDLAGFAIHTAVFDERYVWLSVRKYCNPPRLPDPPRLAVFDPHTHQCWRITAADGLPVVPEETIPHGCQRPSKLLIEPAGPGRVLFVSWFGRLAIGTATFDPEQGARIDAFFEARHQPDGADPEPWRDPEMAFQPGYLFGFCQARHRGAPMRRVLVLPTNYAYNRHVWPLVVDPDARSVEVAPHPFPGNSRLELRDLGLDSQYQYYPGGKRFECRRIEGCLTRVGLPDFVPEALMVGTPEGFCVKYGDKFLIFGSRCWLLDPEALPCRQIQVVAARPPWQFRNFSVSGQRFAGDANEPPKELVPFECKGIFRSNHFGLIAVRYSMQRGCEWFRLVFDEP